MQGNRGVIYEDRDFYQMLAGWSRSGWNIRVSAMNMFRNDWLCSTSKLMTPLYSETQFVTYTFGYGKKVNRGNEVGEQYGAASAIMK